MCITKSTTITKHIHIKINFILQVISSNKTIKAERASRTNINRTKITVSTNYTVSRCYCTIARTYARVTTPRRWQSQRQQVTRDQSATAFSAYTATNALKTLAVSLLAPQTNTHTLRRKEGRICFNNHSILRALFKNALKTRSIGRQMNSIRKAKVTVWYST